MIVRIEEFNKYVKRYYIPEDYHFLSSMLSNLALKDMKNRLNFEMLTTIDITLSYSIQNNLIIKPFSITLKTIDGPLEITIDNRQ